MRISLTSVFVDDQAKAERFYTDVLGFAKKFDFPVGEFRWLTVVSPEEPEGTQLVLEPDENPAAKAYKDAVYAQGIPVMTFGVTDIDATYARMTELGVTFTVKPTHTGGPTVAVFDDTCGNLIQLVQG